MSNHDETAINQLGQAFLSHANQPRNLGTITEPDGSSRLTGKCGDSMRIDLKVHDGVIDKIRVVPEGCVFTKACASVVSELAKQKTLEQALKIEPEDIKNVFGSLPDDHMHCARLAVNTLGEAIAEVLRREIPQTAAADNRLVRHSSGQTAGRQSN